MHGGQTLHEEALSQLNATQSRVAFMQGMIQHKDQLIQRLQSLVDANARSVTPQLPAGRGEGEAAATTTTTGTGHEGNLSGHQGVAPPASEASDASAGSSSHDAATRPGDEGLRDGGAEEGVEGAGADVQTEGHQADAGAEAEAPGLAAADGGHVSPVSTPTPAERLARLQGGGGAEEGVGGVGGALTPSQKLQMLLDKKGVRRVSTADGGVGSLPPLPPNFSSGGGNGAERLPNGAGALGDAFSSPRKGGAKGSPRFTYL